MNGLLGRFLPRPVSQPYDERLPPILGGGFNLDETNGRLNSDYLGREIERRGMSRRG